MPRVGDVYRGIGQTWRAIPPQRQIRDWIALCAAYLHQDIGRLMDMDIVELAGWASEARSIAKARARVWRIG